MKVTPIRIAPSRCNSAELNSAAKNGEFRIVLTIFMLAAILQLAACAGYTGKASSGNTSQGNSPAASPVLQLSPSASSLAFGNAPIGTPQTQNLTLMNTGNSNVNISSVSASGAGFSFSGGSNVILAPNQSANIAVTFDATGTGSATGSVQVSSNAPALQIGLSGTGVNPSAQHSVTLNWSPSASSVAGYFVYRGSGSNGALSKLMVAIIPTTSYTDSSVLAGETYNYAVTSVDFNNIESVASNQTSATIPSQ